MKTLSLIDIADNVALRLRQNIEGTPSEEDLNNAIEDVSKMFSIIGQIITDEEKEKVKAALSAKLVINMDTGIMIVDRNTYKPWLSYRKAEIEEYYWERYKEYLLSDKRWEDNVVSALDRVGDETLDLLGNPMDQNNWKRKGLILGDIQSGKTSTYLALINKAADAGYKLIILLSGTLEALRKQTHKMTSSQKKHFMLVNPKSQLFDKTTLAKIENAWRGFPHTASAGAQKSFKK